MNPFNHKITRATRHMALMLLASFLLVSCGGGGSTATNATTNAGTLNGSATVNTNTITVSNAQTAQIASTVSNADGSTQLVTTANSALGAALTVGNVVQLSGGGDARFPLGLAGKVTSVITGIDGITSAVLTNATLADVVQKSSFQTTDVALNSTNFVGVISPMAVQAAATTQPQPFSALQHRVTALNGGLVFSEPNLFGQIANKTQSGLSFLGGNGTVDVGEIKLTFRGIKLANMGLDSTRFQPYGTGAEASFDIVGSIKNLKLIENHDFDTTAGITTGLKSMDMRVTGDVDVGVNLHGGVTANLGFFSQAWKEVEAEQLKLLGISAKLTGLDSKDKIGKFPIAGLVFAVPCPPTGCPILLGQTQTPLQAAKAGGVIVWVYLTANGTVTLDGEVGARLNAGSLNLGLQKLEGGKLVDVHELNNSGTGRLIEAPYFNGEASATFRLGTEIDVDFFTLGVRIANASMFTGGQANATLKTTTPVSYGTNKLGEPWTWVGQACIQSSIGAGAIFSAAVDVGIEADTLLKKINANFSYGGTWPTEEEILIPGWHGIANQTWYTAGAYSNCATTTFALTTNIAGTGIGTVVSAPSTASTSGINCSVGSCTALYNSGASVTLIATPAAGSSFVGWSGGGCSGVESCSVTMNAGVTVTATFSASTPPPIAPLPPLPPIAPLPTVTLTATPSSIANGSTSILNWSSTNSTSCFSLGGGGTGIAGTFITLALTATTTYTVTCTGAGGTASQSAIVTVAGVTPPPPPVPTSTLNDTGITATQCYQAGSDILVACNSAEALALNSAQDGMVGRDANPATNSSADGKLGFSFTAVPASGVDAGGCVQDNVTGLMWEVKTADGGLRDWNKIYTNYDSTLSAQKWNGAAYVAPTPAEIDAPTNSVGFKNSVNAQGLCGFNDWRLPTADELQSLVDYSVAYPVPTIDASWFPNTQATAFWSSSPYVGVTYSAWHVYFGVGYVGFNVRSVSNPVRLVRAGQ